MHIAATIARHLLEVNFGENWTEVWISKTLEDVSWEEAMIRTPASSNTIASLLHHITFYNKVIESRLKGINPVISEANGYDNPSLYQAEDWDKLKEDNLQSAQMLAEAIRKLPDEVLGQPILKDKPSDSYYKQLHGVIEHTYYHLGQIVILKNLIKVG